MTPTRMDIEAGVYGVLGHEIGYSLSPAIFREVFDALGWTAVYGLFDVPKKELPQFLMAARSAVIHGLSVTKPYKTKVLGYLDRIDPTAKTLGSVNAIAVYRGRLVGHNTDIAGVVATLAPVRKCLAGKHALVFGAGGAARAVAYALIDEFRMSHITFAARNPRRAKSLALAVQEFSGAGLIASAGFTPTESLEQTIASSALIVNATPLGGSTALGESPISTPRALARGAVVFDLNYRPRETRLMKQARARNCRHIFGGWTMLVAQADAAFRIWTGRGFPELVYRDLLRRPLAR